MDCFAEALTKEEVEPDDDTEGRKSEKAVDRVGP